MSTRVNQAGRSRRRSNRRWDVESLEPRSLLSTTIQEFPVPTANALPTAITVGPDGNLWFTESGAEAIGRLNPATHAIFEVPFESFISNGELDSVTAAPDGNLWFTGVFGRVGNVNPTNGVVTQNTNFLLTYPSGISVGPDGLLYDISTVEAFGDKPVSAVIGPVITSYNPFNGDSQSSDAFGPTVPASATGGTLAGPDGRLWAVIGTTYAAFHVNGTGNVTEAFDHTLQTNVQAGSQSVAFGINGNSITVGPDGALWVIGTVADNPDAGSVTTPTDLYVARIDPTTQAVTTYAVPGNLTSDGDPPASIVAGSDGNLWFTEPDSGRVGMVNPTTDAITSFALPTANSAPSGIAAGPDGDIWFTEQSANQVGVVRIADGPRVTGLQRYGIHAQPTTLVLSFTGPLDPATADDVSNYGIVGPHGGKIAVTTAAYDATAHTVTLAPKHRLNIHATYKLTVNGTTPGGVTDLYGTRLDGAKTGSAGSNFTAKVNRSTLVLPHRRRK